MVKWRRLVEGSGKRMNVKDKMKNEIVEVVNVERLKMEMKFRLEREEEGEM